MPGVQGSKLPSAEQIGRYKEQVQRVLAHNNTLPEDALRRALVHNGQPTRMHKFFHKVLAGGLTRLLPPKSEGLVCLLSRPAKD